MLSLCKDKFRRSTLSLSLSLSLSLTLRSIAFSFRIFREAQSSLRIQEEEPYRQRRRSPRCPPLFAECSFLLETNRTSLAVEERLESKTVERTLSARESRFLSSSSSSGCLLVSSLFPRLLDEKKVQGKSSGLALDLPKLRKHKAIICLDFAASF